MRRILRLDWRLASLALWSIFAPAAAWAAELVWIGGTDSSWQTPTNWAPFVVPGEDPIQRVPQDGDTVLISDTTHGNFVQLDGDSARLAGLTISGGMELNTTGQLLRVEAGGAAATVILGQRSQLTVPSVFETDLLHVLEGGRVALAHPGRPDEAMTARVSHGARIDEMSQLTGNGRAVFGNAATPADTVVLNNEGTLRPAVFGLFLATLGGGLIDYDGETETGMIDADEPRDVWFVAEGSQADAFSDSLAVGAGDLIIELRHLAAARVELNGGGIYSVGGQFLATDTSIDVRSSGGFTAYSRSQQFPQIQMTGVSLHVHENTQLSIGSDDQGAGHELAGTSFLLDDGSTLNINSYESLSLTFDEVDLDGETRPTTINIGIFGSLGINAPRIDNDANSPAFNGTIFMQGGGLIVNIPGSWELDGRLELVDGSINRVRGSTIIVDGGEPGAGIFAFGATFPAEIYADVILTQNAQIELGEGSLIEFGGSITHLLRSDYNDNGQVEQGDLDLVLLNWGRDANTPPDEWTNDLPSGIVDQDELDKLLLYWGGDMSLFAGLPAEQGRAGQAGAVPEPGTVALAAVFAVAILWKQYRGREPR